MSTVLVKQRDQVRHIVMTRPERRNAFNAELIGDLHAAFEDVGDARAVVFSGEGESFSAGADVDWMRSSVDLTYEENCADAERLRSMLLALDACPVPTIARVHGHALGGGAGLVACCDVVLTDRATLFSFSEVKLGLIPAVISPFVIERIGAANARRYFLTGERFDAAAALRMGLVHEIPDGLDAAVDSVVAEILAAGPDAVRAAKRLVRERPDGRATAELIASVRATPEAQEGLRAFLEKRRPDWRA